MPKHNHRKSKRTVNSSKGSRRGSSSAWLSRTDAKVFALNGMPLPKARHYVPDSQEFRASLSYEVSTYYSTGISSETYGVVYFTLANFAGYAAYAALFDQYRCDSVEVWLIPRQNAVATNVSAPLLVTVIDWDDGNVASSTASLVAYNNSVVHSAFDGVYRSWVPATQGYLYQGGSGTGHTEQRAWIDTTNSAVDFYGLKIACTGSGTNAVLSFDLNVRANFTFRSAR